MEDERPSGAHLDFTDVEPEPEEGFEERGLAECDNLRYGEVLAECEGGRLEAVVGVKSSRAGIDLVLVEGVLLLGEAMAFLFAVGTGESGEEN
ncbi:hypothetical protein RHMOL_Rhmol02G0103800 [Rhododendron molle]|uniref:Uncharacterized protein n=1 Tax=Rhododendron molle TaxID=49168 RepID=A0ACC0PRQ5_RHOML|nr:hypothetical protein RHMOL_Rhmol02G0103800 [Rhododendron molle]